MRTIVRTVVVGMLVCGVAWPLAAQVPNHQKEWGAARSQMQSVTLKHDEAGALLNAFAWAYRAEGFGLLRKSGGNRCTQPGGVDVSCDWLVHQPSGLGCDALVDAPGTDKNTGKLVPGVSKPNWCSEWEPFDITKFVAPIQPVGGPVVNPPQPDPGPSDPGDSGLSQLAASVADLTSRVAALTEQLSVTREQLRGVSDRTGVLESRPFPTCSAQSVSTGRSWGHAHTVTVEVCK